MIKATRMNRSCKFSAFPKYYFEEHDVIETLTKQLTVVGLKFQLSRV
ncbi:hypothetical protein NPIRD3C_0518 [Nitrosopumilus piranensis]|uniref:Uncharacterized protein n=1 Tax=Nitrosopumilus piranensis TaxID=1582439 RepID=A0A0C5C937_9ARCH|nr:hypothetical protein NPIRD3C_0518 [Nitrosopumilus piranensis]